jgi:hypothetical protein
MGWKLLIVVGLLILWIIWPSIRIPKDNFLRRKLGTFGTYLLLIVGIMAIVQVLEFLIGHGRH